MHHPGLSSEQKSAWRPLLFAIAGALCAPATVSAQFCDSAQTTRAPLVLLQSAADERIRDATLLGRCRPTLIRSALTASPQMPMMGWMPRAILPTAIVQWNSTLPESMNDGALWAGRGLSSMVTGGARLDREHLSVVFAPEIVATQNRGFPIIASTYPNRSEFASPWHGPPQSADLPIRFGTAPLVNFFFGQSTVEAHTSRLGIGFTTENQWWGPGLRNAIVMSNNAPGFPHAYVRSRRPLATPLGEVEARWQLGLLTKSRFFDLGPGSGYRSISSAVIALRTAFDSGLTIGAARSVYSHVNEIGEAASHLADVFWRWNQYANPYRVPGHPSDQIASVFFQWNFPDYGLETFGEWARLIPIRSMRDLIVDPQSTQGYTVGLQWLEPLTNGHYLRFQFEATDLAQNPALPGQRIRTFYTSNLSPQGYTQRGQVVGAAIGPGSSSQYIGIDALRGADRIGVLLGRIRWEDEAYYQQITGVASHRHHDVSLFAGLRGARRAFMADVSGELIFTWRDNYLFQSGDVIDFSSAFDMPNLTLKLTASPGR